jgi:hypothetical protein
MRLEVGKKYKDREGNCVTIVSDKGYGEDHFIGITRDSDGYDISYNYRENGRYFINEASLHDLVAEWTEPKPPQYVPYTWEDRDQLRGRWYRHKQDGVEAMICRLKQSGEKFFINSLSSGFFLDSCEWLGGTPCGKMVEE